MGVCEQAGMCVGVREHEWVCASKCGYWVRASECGCVFVGVYIGVGVYFWVRAFGGVYDCMTVGAKLH